MSSKKAKTEEAVKSLLVIFEYDMIKGWEYPQKFWNSWAMLEIVKYGKKALRPIIKHLGNILPNLQKELIFAWTRLLSLIAIAIREKETAPEELENLKDWLDWAEKFA